MQTVRGNVIFFPVNCQPPKMFLKIHIYSGNIKTICEEEEEEETIFGMKVIFLTLTFFFLQQK